VPGLIDRGIGGNAAAKPGNLLAVAHPSRPKWRGVEVLLRFLIKVAA
jgi:hypothetical protein